MNALLDCIMRMVTIRYVGKCLYQYITAPVYPLLSDITSIFVLCRNSAFALLFSSPRTVLRSALDDIFTLRAPSSITEFPLYNSLRENGAQMPWIFWGTIKFP